jgi:hypothetical protein
MCLGAVGRDKSQHMKNAMAGQWQRYRWQAADSGIGSLHACRPGGQQYQCGEAQRPAQSCPVDGSGMQRDHSTRTVTLDKFCDAWGSVTIGRLVRLLQHHIILSLEIKGFSSRHQEQSSDRGQAD